MGAVSFSFLSMKKTLFLALAFGWALSPAMAYMGTDSNINVVVGDETVKEDLNIAKTPGFNGNVLCVGTHAGDGRLEVEENVVFTVPNALMIGGKGYALPYTTAGNGVVVVKPGAVINVGAATASSGGHHVDVGNSAYDITGELHINGGTVNATQLIIGLGGTGRVVVDNDGTINLSRKGVTGNQINCNIGDINGGHFGKATLIFDHGNLTDDRGTYDFIGYGGKAEVALTNGSKWESNGDLYLGTDYQAAYDPEDVSGHLSVSADSSFSNHYIYVMDNGTIDNAGTFSSGSMDVYEGALNNAATGTLTSDEIDVGTRGTLRNSGTMNVEVLVSTYGGSITNESTGTVNFDEAYSELGSSLVNKGTMSGDWLMITDEGTVENSGSITAGQTISIQNATLLNQGTVEAGAILLQDKATLTTGFAVVSGCESEMAQTHQAQIDYASGISDTTSIFLQAAAGDTVTIGAYVSGKDSMQHLYTEDFLKLNATIQDTLALKVLTDTEPGWAEHTAADGIKVKVANIIGENIATNVTTDDVSVNGSITLALSGSNLVVRVGTNGSADPTAEDKNISAEKIGTLGSYSTDVSETNAGVRLHTEAADSSVAWEGHYMETVKGETATIVDSTKVTVGSETREGTLTVVTNSTLQNEGAVKSDNLIVKGTLDNNGTISASTTVQDGATLKGSGTMGQTLLSAGSTFIVGNSPGATTFMGDLVVESGSSLKFSVSGLENAADAGHKGWESLTYSQIVVKGEEAAVTLSESADIVIAFGGSELFSAGAELHSEQVTEFALTLISGGMENATVDFAALMSHTTFTITDEAAGLPVAANGTSWYINVTDAAYNIVGNDLVLSGNLHITRTPEPATATLSLLALAALAARRRR